MTCSGPTIGMLFIELRYNVERKGQSHMLSPLQRMNKLYTGFKSGYSLVSSWRLLKRRVPELQQPNAVKSDAAWLAMILNYHGRKTTIAEVREACSLGREGLSGLTIVRADHGYSLRVRDY